MRPERGSRPTGARTREVRTVQEIEILVDCRSKHGNIGIVAARGRRGGDAGGGLDEVEHAESANRDRGQLRRVETAGKSGPFGVCGAPRLHRNGFSDASEPHDDRAFDRALNGDRDVLLTIPGEAGQLDLQRVASWGEPDKTELPFLVGQRRGFAGYQGGSAHDNRGTREDALGTVHHSSAQCSCKNLSLCLPRAEKDRDQDA